MVFFSFQYVQYFATACNCNDEFAPPLSKFKHSVAEELRSTQKSRAKVARADELHEL